MTSQFNVVLSGIIPIDALNGFNDLFHKRIADVPQSKSFYDHVGNLQGTKERFPWAKSIVILSFNYGKYRYPKELRGKYAKAFFRSLRYMAAKAGSGIIRKNNFS